MEPQRRHMQSRSLTRFTRQWAGRSKILDGGSPCTHRRRAVDPPQTGPPLGPSADGRRLPTGDGHEGAHSPSKSLLPQPACTPCAHTDCCVCLSLVQRYRARAPAYHRIREPARPRASTYARPRRVARASASARRRMLSLLRRCVIQCGLGTTLTSWRFQRPKRSELSVADISPGPATKDMQSAYVYTCSYLMCGIYCKRCGRTRTGLVWGAHPSGGI